MQSRLRVGMLAGAILLAPVAAAVPASAIPLQPAEPAEQSQQVAGPGCPGGAPHWSCLLESLSASGSRG
ncbi:hypothetical protein OHA40_29705 [Nocardia sp. NBC_00508]|uniref:hypothetical protein n=1 Tax=Nocardia sp. NBC_00508 TaxID=2975992 RepID=UPI002E809C44|nr:hypothetical protein [Nocardia sp. NBC_00508]WUD65741.1 hypothetical protein OHA40_29705 [Nocardia sp. NBC_00508]